MAAARSFLSGLVLSAVVLSGLAVPAVAAQTPAAVQPPGDAAFTLAPPTMVPSAAVPANLVVAQSLPLVATVYDKAGRVTSITATNTAAAVLAKRAYTYTTHATTARDGSLRKTMTTEAGTVTTYTYDAVQRLKTAVTASVTEAWTYDLNGNRLTAAKTGTGTVHSA